MEVGQEGLVGEWILDGLAREGLTGKVTTRRILNSSDNGRHFFHVPNFNGNIFNNSVLSMMFGG